MKKFLLALLLLISLNANSEGFYHNGIYRSYLLHIPAHYSNNKALPLLIALHGGFGSGENMQKFTGFNALADKDTFIVVYPDGYEKHWNDGRNVPQYKSQAKNVDDVGFISALIDTLIARYHADNKRVYVTGISNGGMMTYRLAIELGNKIAAVAPVIANMPVNISNKKAIREIPILIIDGTADPLMPYEGGEIWVKNKSIGKVLSVQQSFDYFVKNNKCDDKLKHEAIEDKSPTDGCTATKDYFDNCSVILYTIQNGGHTWPGGAQYLPRSMIGPVCMDFNATEVVWDFLKLHRMR